MSQDNCTVSSLSNELEKLKNQVALLKNENQILQKNNALVNKDLNDFRNLFHTISDQLYILDTDFNFIKVNDKVSEFYGIPTEEFVGKPMGFLNSLRGTSIQRVAEHVRPVLSGDVRVLEYQIQKPGGDIYTFESHTYHGTYKGEEAVYSIVRDITEERKAKDKLKLSERSYKDLFDNFNSFLFILDNDGICYDVSKNTLIKMELELENAVGQHFTKLIDVSPMELTEVQSNVKSCSKENKSEVVSCDIIVNGARLSVDIYTISLTYFGEQRVMLKCYDKTETLKRNELINQQRDLLKLTVQASNIFQVRFDCATRNMDFRDQVMEHLFWKVLGYDKMPLTQDTNSPKITPLEDFEVLKKYTQDICDGKHPESIQIRHIKKDGSFIWFDIRGHEFEHDVNGKPVFLSFLMIDISSIKLMQEALKESEKGRNREAYRFKMLFEHNIDGISILKQHEKGLKYLDVNSVVLEQLGGKVESTVGEYVSVAFPGLEATETFSNVSKAIASQIDMKLNSVKARYIGGDKYFDIQILPISHSEVILITRDVTNEVNIRHQLQKQNVQLFNALEKAQESEQLKTAFLANMSHEIRTPMNGILGFASMLEEPGLSNGEQQEFVSIIKKSGERMLRTVNNIIDISKIEAGQVDVHFSWVDINELMCEIFEFFEPEAQSKNLNFSLEVLSDIPNLFYTDIDKLNSIVTNLIKNALKYTPEGRVKVTYSFEDQQLVIHVEDTGIGIVPERKDAIFNRFEQADIEDTQALEGAGLGLSITQAYIQMLNASIEVISEVNVGSVFTVVIPVVENVANNNELTQAESRYNSTDDIIDILVVEDDPISMSLLELLLSKMKFHNVLKAPNGVVALERCKENNNIAIVLMDIRMPEMGGYKACELIKQSYPEIKIIAQTSNAFKEDKEKAFDIGFDDYLTKPISGETLRKSIMNVLNSK